ncbi:PD-(D/E)XK nuclease family protein [Variovorax sp. JS1663]|uniref:PD-(D/E)XK nuclease family protein n=1 Tax=Variovorax sp. JS1663 TaxID=1851577 RepID=UPI0013028F6E|nr:PD-(D/E)XK nuclease family protein [Variovorax sp. JS1663]
MAPVVGRQGFLGLLETYLGLSGPEVARAQRVAAYQGFLEQAQATVQRFYSQSFAADSVGTAARLLEWRDEWYLAGWDGSALERSPVKLRDLAAVEALAAGGVAAGEGERLAVVATAMRAGAKVPVDQVMLADDLELYPAAWATVLELLPCSAPLAPASSAVGDLGQMQTAMLAAVAAGKAAGTVPLAGDGTLEVLQANSQEVAQHWLSATVRSEQVDCLIVCEDGGAALDASLEATGVATCGFGAASDLRPALQLLGLACETCWTPIDVPRLVEFLVHPIGTFTAKARRPLAEALAAQPGIGGESWRAAKDSLMALDNAEAVLDEVVFWFEGQRWDRHAGAPVSVLAQRADRVNEALKRLASAADAEFLGVGPALHQCEAVLAGLAEFQRQGVALLVSRQVEQLVSQATPGGATNPYGASQVGCLQSASVAAVCSAEQASEVIWWMPSTPVLPRAHPWSATELAGLKEVGVQLRDPAAEMAALSRQWLRPILAAKRRFVLVLPPPGCEEHPIWQLVHRLAPSLTVKRLEGEVLAGANGLASVVTRVPLVTAERYIELGKPISSRRKEQSFTSLNDLFNNPALAVLKDVAGLRTATVLEASEGSQLLGTLGHRVVEKLFQQEGALAWTPAQAGAWFDEMVGPLLQEEGAPLLMPGASVEAHRFKQICRRAITSLLLNLQQAGAVKVETEAEIKGTFEGEPFIAKVDLLVTLANKRTVILDLKWSWAKGFREKLVEGRHLQLALYAELVRQTLGSLPVTVGYFVFQGAELLVAHPGVFEAAEVCAPESNVTLPELVVGAVATWKWRREQWAAGQVEWVDKRFGKLVQLGGPVGTLPLEEVGRYDGEYLALMGAGWRAA